MQAVVEILASEGTAFGCPGAAMLPHYQALQQHSGIDQLVVRHEEAATHMADCWARTTGKAGVAIGTSGPAGTNMITGLCTAQADSIPILCITGQAVSTKRPGPVLIDLPQQEIERDASIDRPLPIPTVTPHPPKSGRLALRPARHGQSQDHDDVRLHWHPGG
jgi:tartronate-semialdehyde synthase